MSVYLGLDTSHYTTSGALYHIPGGEIRQIKQPLPVPEGRIGLRQSEAVFAHTKQLPDVLERLFSNADGKIDGIGVSDRPQQAKGSYMPCFLVGLSAARSIAAVTGKPLSVFTHQQGHVAAALYGCGHLEWLRAPFIAFHVSGGTTDALLIEPSEEIISCRVAAKSLDLKAGQLIDRVGIMLGLPFPAGKALERLALRANGVYRPKPSTDGGNCHLSGVENQCASMWKSGAPKEEVARFCLASVEAAIAAMTEWMLRSFGDLPLLYAGGVMSNRMLRESFTSRFGGAFAPPEYSADNAAGIAVLAAWRNIS